MMFVCSGLLILINRRTLPAPIRIRGFRLAMLIWAIVLFGTLSALAFQAQIQRLLGGWPSRRPHASRRRSRRFPTQRGMWVLCLGCKSESSVGFPRSRESCDSRGSVQR